MQWFSNFHFTNMSKYDGSNIFLFCSVCLGFLLSFQWFWNWFWKRFWDGSQLTFRADSEIGFGITFWFGSGLDFATDFGFEFEIFKINFAVISKLFSKGFPCKENLTKTLCFSRNARGISSFLLNFWTSLSGVPNPEIATS